jgi:hypothetical protein
MPALDEKVLIVGNVFVIPERRAVRAWARRGLKAGEAETAQPPSHEEGCGEPAAILANEPVESLLKRGVLSATVRPGVSTPKTVRFLSEPCLVFDPRDSPEGDVTASYDSTVWSRGLGRAVRTTRGSSPRKWKMLPSIGQAVHMWTSTKLEPDQKVLTMPKRFSKVARFLWPGGDNLALIGLPRIVSGRLQSI